MTLEEFLREAGDKSFRIRNFVDDKGEVSFYIYPNDLDGDSLSFRVDGNYLVRI